MRHAQRTGHLHEVLELVRLGLLEVLGGVRLHDVPDILGELLHQLAHLAALHDEGPRYVALAARCLPPSVLVEGACVASCGASSPWLSGRGPGGARALLRKSVGGSTSSRTFSAFLPRFRVCYRCGYARVFDISTTQIVVNFWKLHVFFITLSESGG